MFYAFFIFKDIRGNSFRHLDTGIVKRRTLRQNIMGVKTLAELYLAV
jgi:hypothetical protein